MKTLHNFIVELWQVHLFVNCQLSFCQFVQLFEVFNVLSLDELYCEVIIINMDTLSCN